MNAKPTAARLESAVEIRLTRDDRDQLERICQKRGIPMSRFIRDATIEALSREGKRSSNGSKDSW
jgi:hypothetical protein